MDSAYEMGPGGLECLGPHSSFLGLDLPETGFEGVRALIIPAPYDGTTTYRSGTREGPRAILAASRELELFDEETCTEAYRHGIATLAEVPVTVSSPRDMVDNVRAAASSVISAGKLPVLLGGEHLLSLGMIEAVAQTWQNVTILHVDAHADLRETYQGSPYSNACIMRLALKHASLVQVGIRALTAEENDFIRDRHIPCFFAYQLHRQPELYGRILPALGENVYISIDLDGFDPSIMPAVGTPEPGGLGWYEVLSLLRLVTKNRRVVGFDVMELLPIPQTAAPDLLAARLVYKLLSYIFLDNPLPC